MKPNVSASSRPFVELTDRDLAADSSMKMSAYRRGGVVG
jgi:hypothetical protein